MERKKILIPNGNPSEFQLINAAHRLGLYVITSGNNKLAPAHQFADKYVPADFSDKEALLAVAKEEKIDYICSNSNDIALMSVAYVAEALGLPGHDSYETTLRLHHKDNFKRLAEKLDLHVPEGHSFASRKDALTYAASLPYKYMVKPVDLVGGNGMTAVEPGNAEAREKAVNKAFHDSLCKRIVIERFIEGTAHSLSCFLVDRKVASCFTNNEYTLGKPFKISTSASPADGFDTIRELIYGDIEKVAEDLKLKDGYLHLQYQRQDGKPYVLEMSRRLCGDMYSVPESYALGYNTVDYILKAECGMSIQDIPRNPETGRYGYHCITADREGVTNGIRLDPRLDVCVMKKWLWGAFDHQVSNCKNDILGLLFFHFESREQAVEIMNHVMGMVTVEMKE